MHIVEKFRPNRKKRGKQALFANVGKKFLAAREKRFLSNAIVKQVFNPSYEEQPGERSNKISF
jgi:hypothetical protein